jgi:hypothetical protein
MSHGLSVPRSAKVRQELCRAPNRVYFESLTDTTMQQHRSVVIHASFPFVPDFQVASGM